VDSLFLFTARPFDPDTGLQNNLNRWYDPSVGRWLSEDPIGFAAGDANVYRYVGNAVVAASDTNGTDQTLFAFGSSTSVRHVHFYDSECCTANGVTHEDMRKIALAAVEACDAIDRAITLLDNYLPKLQSEYPDTGARPSLGAIANGPPKRLATFRENLGRCAQRCNKGKIEFRCKQGGHCDRARERECEFYTDMSWWSYEAKSEMFVCVDNDPTRGLPKSVLHELARWCGRQYFDTLDPPEYSVRYSDSALTTLDHAYKRVVGTQRKW